MTRQAIILLGPSRDAISGVSTHLNLLFASALAREFSLVHFQVGSEGRAEGALRRAARLAASPARLAAAILARRARVVHINTSLDARAYWRDLVYLAVAKLCGVRVVYQVHGGALPHEFFGSRVLRGLLSAVLRWPDVVVVLAAVEREAYERFVPGQNIVMLPHGIDCTSYAAPARAVPAPDASLRLIYLGRLAPGKGLPETLEALSIARARGIAARLVIAGSGPEEASLRARVRALGLEQAVAFAGPAYGEDKARLFRAADVMLLPSYSEGLPYALLEAMAAGVVPVVTPVGAMPDVLLQGVHGMFVPPRDAAAIAESIAALDRDRAALARMSAACRSRVAGAYSLSRVAADFAAVYGGVCAARAPRAAL